MVLGKLGDARAVEPLVRTLGESEFSIRNLAACALKRILKDREDEALERALRDPDAAIRRGAAEFPWKGPKAARLMLEALADEDAQVRENAACSLNRMFERTKPPEQATTELSCAIRKLDPRPRGL